jgi:hypothetical protein
VDPGATDQPAHHDQRQGQQQPELDHDPAALGAPAQLAVLVGPGMGALDRVGASRVTSGDLRVLMDQPTEPIPSRNPFRLPG